MRLQPNRDYVSNDNIQTPPALARRLVAHFAPRGHLLEPCAGDGNFLRALRTHARTQSRRRLDEGGASRVATRHSLPAANTSHVSSCEVQHGVDFFAWDQSVDWIITNPPWSQLRRFLKHALAHADHVVFLCTINHLWTRARLHDVKVAGFGLKEIVLFDTPQNFPPMGFQVGTIYLRRGWKGLVKITDWTSAPPAPNLASSKIPRPRY